VIVDRNEINPDIVGTIPQINVSGLSNTISSVDISSKISSNISAQVAIAAQGNTGNYKENVATILEWNKGAIDRHLPIRSPSNVKTSQEVDKRRKQFLKDLAKIWRDFNGTVKLTRNYDPSKIEDVRSEANADLQSLSKSHRRLSNKAPTGVIPVELSMELIGIFGFVIGTTFRINKGLLPRKYDNWAYIVTGIEHEISENNRWYTRVKTQFFPIRID